ncbi:MAG: hypothetical protein LBN39_03495 [Planctomycetaceae bacterium]|jgi:hypothetical protein|nr:hypothetical protein [Planctomycetaceae bacterium]
MKTLRYFIVLSVIGFSTSVFADDSIREKAEQVNRNIWGRFISSDNTMFDYVGTNGEVSIPTAEECEKCMPNALGWWSPIENGGYFGGIYLISQCMRYENAKTPENKEKVKRLIQGLYKLQDVGNTPGFIARGVSADGKTTYPISSADQTMPFIIGLWRYLKTDIPNEKERAECQERLFRHVETIKKNDWILYGTRKEYVNDSLSKPVYLSIAHILFVLWIMDDLTDDPSWRNLFVKLLDPNDPVGAVRRKNLVACNQVSPAGAAWIVSTCQYGLYVMYPNEPDPELKQIFKDSLENTARMAVKSIEGYKNYNPEISKNFTPDWRKMMPPHREQKTTDEARQLAGEQVRIWNRICPAWGHEKNQIMQPICAAWIVALSHDKNLIDSALPEIKNAILKYDYDIVHYAAFFYVENLIYTLNAVQENQKGVSAKAVE